MTTRDPGQESYSLTWSDLMTMPLDERVSVYLGIADAIATDPAAVPADLFRLLGAGVSHDQALRRLLRWPGATEGTPEEDAEVEQLWSQSPDLMRGLSAALFGSTVQKDLTKLRDGGAVTDEQWSAYNQGQTRPEDPTAFELGLDLALAASMLAGGVGAGLGAATGYAAARATGAGAVRASASGVGGTIGGFVRGAPRPASAWFAGGRVGGVARPALTTTKTLYRGISEGSTRVLAGILRKTPTEVAAMRRNAIATLRPGGPHPVVRRVLAGFGLTVGANVALGVPAATERIINALRNPDDVLSDVAYDQHALADMDATQTQAQRAALDPATGAVRFGSMPVTSVISAVRTAVEQSNLTRTAPQAVEDRRVTDLVAERVAEGTLTSGYPEAPPVPTEPVEQEPPGEPLNQPIGGFSPQFFRDTPGQVTTTVADRATQQRQVGWRPYYTWHTESILGSMTPARLAQTQAMMIDAGLIDPDQQVGGVFSQPGRLDPQTIGAMENVLYLSNANPGTSWQEMLDSLAQEGRRRRVEETEAVVPFIRPAYVAPDYATLAQEVKQIAATKLPRDLQDWEVKLLADELGGFRFDEYEAAVDAARSEFEARQAAERMVSSQERPVTPTTTVADRAEQQIAAGPTPPPTGPEGYPEVAAEGTQAVDASARIAQLIEERYGDEIDRRQRIDEASRNFSTTMASLGAMEQMVGGGG